MKNMGNKLFRSIKNFYKFSFQFIYMRKKAQSALEFIVLFLFIMVIVSLAMYFIGGLSIDLKNSEMVKEREDFVSVIMKEFELIQEMQAGYQRNITIQANHLERFNITFIDDYYMVVYDHHFGNETSSIENPDPYAFYYYEIPGRVNFTYTFKEDEDGRNYGELILRKPKNEVSEGINLN